MTELRSGVILVSALDGVGSPLMPISVYASLCRILYYAAMLAIRHLGRCSAPG
jgi:hypothetical protein